MKRAKRKAQRKTVGSWRQATGLRNRWRKALKTLTFEFKRPRPIDIIPINVVTGKPVKRKPKPRKRFRGRLAHITNDSLVIRRTSGSGLAISRSEVGSISDGKTRFVPQ